MEKAERVDVREGEAESLWPPELVKACLYSVRKKNVNMSLSLGPHFTQKEEKVMSPYLLLVNLPHQEHVICDCGVCLWLHLPKPHKTTKDGERRQKKEARWATKKKKKKE